MEDLPLEYQNNETVDPLLSEGDAPYTNLALSETITIDEAVDRISTGKFQKRILVAAGLCFMSDSIEITLLSFLTLVLGCEWGWEDAKHGDEKIATITSSMFIGSLIGTLVLGPLGDRAGRRPALFCAAFIISFFGFATAFCTGFYGLLFVRFCVGFG